MTSTMKTRIEEHPEFFTLIRNDPVQLMAAIRASMHEAVRAQKNILTATQALIKFVTYKQNDSSLRDYMKDFKELRDVFETQWGTNIVYTLIDGPAYDAATDDEKEAMVKEKFDEWTATLFLHNSDPKRYGSVNKELAKGFALERDEYPKTLKKALDIMGVSAVDRSDNDYKSKPKHESRSDSKSEKSFAQKKSNEPIKCFCCGDPNHKSTECPYKNKVPDTEWFKVTKTVPKVVKKTYTQSAETDTDDDSSATKARSSNRRSETPKKSKSKAWSNFMIDTKLQLHQDSRSEVMDMIILDSGSTIGATIANPKLVTNITTTDKPIRMATNAGVKELNTQA